MSITYNDIQWVVQSNLTNKEDFAALRDACKDCGVRFFDINIIPFETSIPEFDTRFCNVFYGSTTLLQLVYADENLRSGVFFDKNNFSIENYIQQWGAHMLNYGAVVTTFKEFMQAKYNADKLFFIRPDSDGKSFSGEVKRFDEISVWYEQITMFDNAGVSPDTKIVIAEPYHLQSEWRLWVVNKKVVAASLYREAFRLKKEEGCPPGVLSFAEERCKEYTPHDVFVMDVCLCGDKYYIIECNCMNGAGFYRGNVRQIVQSVTEYMCNPA